MHYYFSILYIIHQEAAYNTIKIRKKGRKLAKQKSNRTLTDQLQDIQTGKRCIQCRGLQCKAGLQRSGELKEREVEFICQVTKIIHRHRKHAPTGCQRR